MALPESFQADDVTGLPRKVRRDDGNDDNNNDNNRSSTQTFTSTTSGTSTTRTSPTSALVATTSLSSPTSTTLSPSRSAIPVIASTLTSTSSLSFAAISATSTPSASSPSTPSRTTIVLDVVGACAGASVFILVLFCIYKSLRRRRKPTLDISTDRPINNGLDATTLPVFARPRRIQSQDTTSIFWGSSQSDSTTVEEIPPSIPPMTYNTANNGVNRRERLGLVRNSLLRPQDRNGPLLQSQSQARRWRGETLFEGRGNEDSVEGPNRNWDGTRMSERDRIDIEASGRWEAPITIAARDSRVESVLSVPRWRNLLLG